MTHSVLRELLDNNNLNVSRHARMSTRYPDATPRGKNVARPLFSRGLITDTQSGRQSGRDYRPIGRA